MSTKGLRLYGALSRAPMASYRGKVLTFAAIAAGLPLGALVNLTIAPGAAPAGAVLGVTFVAVLMVLAGMAQMLAPVGLTARALRACVEEAPALDLPNGYPDEAGQMMADVAHVAARLDGLRHRYANRHPVTGLPTREPFLAGLPDETQAGGEPALLGVIRFADYDRLAAFDQAAADRALKAFSGRLRSAVQPSRPLAQVDRDCFAVWFGRAPDTQAAAVELQAIAYVLGQELRAGLLKLTPVVGLGAAVFPHDGTDPATLLTRAFAALPKPGETISGKLAFFSANSSTAARERFALEQDLRDAIAREQLRLHYQPVVDLAACRVVGAEALLRWRHPELGLVPPGDFIPLLEETGMIDEVGLWVLNTACREARSWHDAGLVGLKMAVNLSARQLRDPALSTMIVRTLERHRLAPEALELELTETAAMSDASHIRQLFGDLRALGVSVAIDDFGAGYSSLSYLKNLPFSKLKIDREFTTHVDERRDSRAICTALIELCRGLDIAVLAEGVETREEVETLRNLGCAMFQGFFFARPMPSEEFMRTIVDPEWLALLASPVHREIARLEQRVRG